LGRLLAGSSVSVGDLARFADVSGDLAVRTGLQRPRLSSMPVEYLTPAIEDRSVEVLTLLADRASTVPPLSLT
jgi:hypothetical protein